MTNKTKKRKTVFIKRSFQMKFVTSVIVLIIVCGICSAAVLYPFLSSEMSNELTTGHRNVQNIKQQMAVVIIVGNVLAIIITALATTVIVINITHKIAGPLYRFEKLCKEIGNGNLNVYSGLREKDQLEGLSEAFGEMITQLRDRRSGQQASIEEARKNLDELQKNLSDPDASKKLIGSIGKRLASLAGEMEETGT